MTTVELSALSDEELGGELERLSAEERHLSARRTTLHERMSFLGAGDTQVALLRDQERQLSETRHALHGRIDLLRAEHARRGLR